MKPVDRTEFWKERLEGAEKNKTLHYSVYIAHNTLWTYIGENHKAIIRVQIPQNSKVLDAGCGYGRASEFLPDNYTGIDFSPDFIAKARELYPNKKFIVGNLKKLPFGESEFDWAICISIKTMIANNLGESEWQSMEKELKRVAKQVLILEYEEPEIYEVI